MIKSKTFLMILLLVATVATGQNTVTFYGQDFKASEILPAGREWGPLGALLITKPITKPQGFGTLYEALGTYYTTKNFNNFNDLLNMSLDEDIPILDSINFSFYNAWAFLNVLDKNQQLHSNPSYTKFKKVFKEAKTNHLRRAILYSDENEIFRSALESARYTNYQPPITIKASTKVDKSFKLGVSANIAAEISKNAKIKGDINNKIQDTVNMYVVVKEARYHEVKLQQDYVSRASRILAGIYKKDSTVSAFDDVFTDALKTFFKDKDAAVVTGAAILEAQFDYEKIKKFQIALGALIDANVDLGNTNKGPKVAADVTAQFNKIKDRVTGVTTMQVFYPIRLVRDSKLEIGTGSSK